MIAPVRKEILSVAARVFSVAPGRVSLARLAGDASARVFYRASTGAGRRRKSLVFALYPPGEGDAITRWFRMAESLRQAGVGVPRVYGSCPQSGYLVMQDCGDDLLQSVAASASRRRVLSLYLRAVDELVRMQAMRPEDYPACPAWSLAFDLKKFLWELDFFLQHTVEGLWGARLSPSERREFARSFRGICARALDMPFAFCHRDYHSRNLLVTRRGLRVIDFQDARLGPYAYDLASLLHDPYVPLPDRIREQALAYYRRSITTGKIFQPEGNVGRLCEAARRRPLTERAYTATADARPRPSHPMNKEWPPGSISGERFRADFDMISVQRLLKAAGTYGYLSRKGKRGYLRYLPMAIGRCLEILDVNPESGSLADLLRKFAPTAFKIFRGKILI
jgi:aminoglycoside/choline kinase family phosphotransferase